MDSPLPRAKADFTRKLRDVPHKPGVYLMRDRLNRIIYVGKARDLRKRVSSYFMPSRRQTADMKTRALIESIWDFEYHVVKTEPESLLLESRLIKEYRPRYNVSLRDDKAYLLVKVNAGDLIPRFQLTRMRKDDGARYFGPFAHAGALRATLNLMRDKFGLRSCRPYQPGEYDFKHCLAPVIKKCPAPCVGKISPEDYRARVLSACEFLEGKSRDTVAELEAEMHAAAAKMNFERAAQLRDMVDNLKRTTAPTRRFTRHSLPTSINPVSDLKALADALSLPHLPLVMECFDISNISSTHIVASMVSFKNGIPDKANYRRFRIRGVKGQNDFASMAEVIRRRYARVLQEAKALHSDAAEYSQENPQDAIERLQRENADFMRRGEPRAGDDRTPDGNANLEGGAIIEGAGYDPDETDVELEDEVEREIEAEAMEADLEPGEIEGNGAGGQRHRRRSAVGGRRRARRAVHSAARAAAGFDHRGRRQGAARDGVYGVAASGLARVADHRPGQGVRGNLPSRTARAAAAAGGFRGVAVAPAHPRRGAPLRQWLPPIINEAARQRERAGRLSRRQREPQEAAAGGVRFGGATAQGDR